MKRLYQTLSGMFAGGNTATITIDGQPGVGQRLKAWWYGQTLVTRNGDRASSGVDLRIRKAKSGNGRRPAAPPADKQDNKKLPMPNLMTRKASSAGQKKTPKFASTLESGSKEQELDFNQASLHQELWGGAQNFPGGINRALEVMEPILRHVNRGDSLLDFGAGCGGLIRHLKTFYGVDATGYDPHPDLAEGSQDTVAQLDVQNPDFGEENFDFVSSLDGLQDMASRRKVLKAAARALKPGGRMMLVDAITARTGCMLNSLDGARSRGFQTTVLSSPVYSALLKDCGLQVVDTKDISTGYGYDVLKGWSEMTERVKTKKMSKEAKALVDQESARWFAKVSALKKGDANMVRMVLAKQ